MSTQSATQNWRSLSWWFTDPETGETVLFQPPNAQMIVVQTTTALQRFGVLSRYDRQLGWLKTAAVAAWAVDELVRGTTPVRRVLGAATLGWQVRKLVR